MTGSRPDNSGVPPWPAAVQAFLDTIDDCRPAVADGFDWSLGPVTLQSPGAGYRTGVGRPAAATVGARVSVAGLAVAPVVAEIDGWLVTEPLPGERAVHSDRHPDPDDLVVAVGRGLRALHDLSPEILRAMEGPESPAEGWQAVADECRAVIDAGLVNVASLPKPYGLYPADDLLAMIVDGRPSIEDLVCCHGGPTMERFIVDNGRFVGFDRIDRARLADRHFDLAIAHQSVQACFGPEAVFRFYDAYGADPDLVRLDHYVLVGQILTRPESVAAQTVEPGPGSAS